LLLRFVIEFFGRSGKLPLLLSTSFFPSVGGKLSNCGKLFPNSVFQINLCSLEINETDELRTKYLLLLVVYVKSLDGKTNYVNGTLPTFKKFKEKSL